MRSKTTMHLYQYWDTLRGHLDVPGRGQIEPADIRHILPDLFILERTAGTTIRFRLAGTHICALFARELRGTTFDALWLAEQTSRMTRIAVEVMTRKTPVILSATALAGSAERLPMEIVLLPMRSPDGTIDRVIGALVPLSRPHWMNSTPVNYLDLSGIRVLDTAKTNVFLQNRPEIALPREPLRHRHDGIGKAIRRVLHLRVFEGGRQD
ncbi:PAS domain-containing protein [Rhizobium sp. 32-5/1]|uniref:PAS domain-containing protein n=1 Tax=Rhizobium sp. 32-5/1 TaxID=3019602 RepID=UPI00240CF7B8|nr:PAS domain-containing protein [Rhizobium sp. 32-5/1]WEZ83673.1 PAS domain-containing protein [Rhizobium sp. 32-5/1]